jgi:hypothetical protein
VSTCSIRLLPFITILLLTESLLLKSIFFPVEIFSLLLLVVFSEMGGACGAYGGRERGAQGVGGET